MMNTEQSIDSVQLAAEANSLRTQLDHLIERFRSDEIIGDGEAARLAEVRAEVRQALEDEFMVLLSDYTPEVLQSAVLMTYDESKRLPIHLACDKNAPLLLMQCLLEADVNNVSTGVPDKWGDLPLHTACSRHQTEVVKLLVESDTSKKSLFTKADNGSLPIHAAARYNAPASMIMLLLESKASQRTLLEPGPYEQLPLHVACRCGAHPDVIELLMNYDEDKKTLLQADNVGRLPIHLALLHTYERQIDVVKILLQGMLCDRMESKGLDLWKADIKRLLTKMNIHERDFTTRDKLDMICDTIKDFMERVFTLELAVWRASCLQFDTQFTSMEQVFDQEASIADGPFDAHGYKVDRRIRSGADIIVRDVIPFLENEPVEELIQKLRDY